jgi:hypothetical protein
MGFARWIVAVVVVCAITPACKHAEPLPQIEGGIEVGLRRGSAWSTLTVRPPYVIGPRVNLRLNKGQFSGTIDGRAVSIKADEQGISGTGPLGNVAIDINGGPEELLVDGTWNDSRVNFRMTPDSVRGTMAVGVTGPHDPDTGRGRRFSNVLSCQYVLDHVEPDGTRTGTSICQGLPEETRLEVPRAAQGWLTRAELVVVLLALFSSPPMTNMEAAYPYSGQ